MQAFEKISNAYWVIPKQFLAGEHPLAYHRSVGIERLNWLLSVGVVDFIDLTQEVEDSGGHYLGFLPEISSYNSLPVRYARFPIMDFGVPAIEEMEAILASIYRSLEQKRTCYLHCQGGIGRTGLVVGCFLVSCGLRPNEALKRLQELRQGTPKGEIPSPETEAQRQMVLSWKGCQNKDYAL